MKQTIRLTESELHDIIKESVNGILNEGMTNPTFMAKTIKSWVMECIMNDDDTALNQAYRMTDAIATGIRQGIHEYEKKRPNNTKTLEFFNNIAKILG
jgi:hypothetical protein